MFQEKTEKSKCTGSVSPLLCSLYLFLLNLAREYELPMNSEFVFAYFSTLTLSR